MPKMLKKYENFSGKIKMSKNNPEIKGYCDPSFEIVKNTFIDNFVHHNELGASVCVFKDGEKVVDLWGGYKDFDKLVELHSFLHQSCAKLL